MRSFAVVLLSVFLCAAAAADNIRSSLLIMDPGASYISCTGHAAFLMQSEERALERCYSYESEPFGMLLTRFLSGKLKMGLFRLPPDVFLEPYSADGRGVRAFRLDLPADMQLALWRVLDERADEGVRLPYDYIRRGCSKAALECLVTAAERCGKRLEFPKDRPYYHLTCREAFGRSIPDYPWTFIALHLIVGTDVDTEGPIVTRIHTPADLLDMLRGTTLEGRPVLSDEGAYIVPPGAPAWHPPFSPLAVSVALLALAVICTLFPRRFRRLRAVMTFLLMSVTTLIGLVTGYTVFLTSIPGTTWNWLLIPFNPLLALFWRWRRRWAHVYAAVVALWTIGMLLSLHMLVDVPYLLLAISVALIVFPLKGSGKPSR